MTQRPPAMVYDVEQRRMVSQRPSGLTTFMSWGRLISHLHRSGEFSESETVTHVTLGDDGLTFTLRQERQP